ncbi:hypothetical protein GCM10022206_35730 [Streptomyces chiangmaiensis]
MRAAKNADGSYTVALFNPGDAPAAVTADRASLGFTGKASVRDLWNHENLGTYKNKVTEALPAHGSRLFTVTPRGGAVTRTAYEAEAPGNTLGGNASVADCSGAHKVGNRYLGGTLRFNDIVVGKAGTYTVKIAYVSGDARSAAASVNGNGHAQVPLHRQLGNRRNGRRPLTLKAGADAITFDSGESGYAPDIDRIDVPTTSS